MAKLVAGEIDTTVNFNEEQPAFMTKGGPGDTSTGGNVKTDAWFQSHKLPRDILDKGTIAQKAKDQEIFFCDIPFTQLYMEIDGNYQPCCFGKGDGKSNILNTTMDEWMKGDAMNGIRNDMLNPKAGRQGEYVKKHCTRCLDDEDRYGKSRRTACMKIHSNDASFWSKVNRAVQMYEASGFFDFDERMITIPAEAMKVKKKIHHVPLSNITFEIFTNHKNKSVDSPYCFPSPMNKSKPIGTESLLRAIRRVGITNDEFTTHGNRHTAATIIGNHLPQHRRDVVDAQLHHKIIGAVSYTHLTLPTICSV